MNGADLTIRWSTALAVIGVAAVAAVASYEHANDLVRAHAESGWTARMIPLTVDGLIYASSMVVLDSARRGTLAAPPISPEPTGSTPHASLTATNTHGSTPTSSQLRSLPRVLKRYRVSRPRSPGLGLSPLMMFSALMLRPMSGG
jgi:hypothetical protein